MKVALITLGCPKNLVDAETMLGLLDEAGHRLVASPDGADVAIVNTCGFIAAAIEESAGVIAECLALKEAGRLGAVLVAGCLPQRFGGVHPAIPPGVDGVVGSASYGRIVEALESMRRGVPPAIIEEPADPHDEDAPRILGTPAHLAYVKIAEGCDNRCSYCTIPDIRGPLRSRPPDAIAREVSSLVAAGIKEINLIAQDTTAYGTDIAFGEGLAGLVDVLAETGAPWIRILYTHPAHVTRALLDVMANHPNVVPYIDVPVQHVADRILDAMGRRIDGAGVRALLAAIRETVEGVAIRSTIIAGFPGETEGEFLELLELVEEGAFDHLGIFEYSPEPGTPAAALPGPVDRDVARARAILLADAMENLTHAAGAALVGSTVRVLVDGGGPAPAGRTTRQAWETDGVVLLPGAALTVGEFADVEITEAAGFDLVGRPVVEDGRSR